MSKYANAQRDAESVFASPSWTSLNIPTYPVNFKVPSDKSEFVKVEFLPLNPDQSYFRSGISGFIIVQIYVPVDQGSTRLMEIADFLDTILQNKTLTNGTKTAASRLSLLGQDSDNPSIFRGDYQVDFNFYN